MSASLKSLLLLSCLGLCCMGCGDQAAPPAKPSTPAVVPPPAASTPNQSNAAPEAASTADTNAAGKSLADATPDLVTTTQEMWEKGDSGEAREKFTGKVIEVKAPMKIINLTQKGIELTLRSEGETRAGLRVVLKDKDLPWKLALPPQIITVRGRGDGKLLFGLIEAEIVKVEGDRCPTATPEDLVKAKQEFKLGEKYEYCIVEGTVADIKDNAEARAAATGYKPTLTITVTFEPMGEAQVAASFSNFNEELLNDVKALKKGDKIKVASHVSEDSLMPKAIKLWTPVLLKE